jgi:hypothetical protein
MTWVFGSCVVGIVLCFGMGVVTAVRDHRAEMNPPPLSIPTPATLPR